VLVMLGLLIGDALMIPGLISLKVNID
jgi:hypothetical protein